MKTGRTLQQLAMELDRQQNAKRDFVLGTQSMVMSAAAEEFRLLQYRPDYAVNAQNSLSFRMTGLFHRQLGATLGIPAKYYDKMQTEHPELLAQNVNGWFRKTPSKHTVRTLDGMARAFLSDRYRRIDNYEIAQATLPIIGEMPDAQVESCEVTETRMYIKVVNPRLEAEVQKGDIVQAGIVISNSEVCLGSVSVMPLAYRLVCLNGMIVNDLGQRKYHAGRELEEAWELYSDATLRAADEVFMRKLGDIVRAAVDEARFAKVINRLREATEVKISGHVPEVVELTSREFGFNKSEQTGILRHLIEGGDLSLYGLSNAVTRTSQDVGGYDRATALENAGWQVATMAPELWKSMSRRANCWDNAPQESLFGHMKDEIDLSGCQTHEQAADLIDDWIDYYNNDRYQWDLEKL